LAVLITTRLRPLSVEEHRELFDRDGAPLGTFYDKIEIGYALRLFDKEVRDELHRIRRIRNAFAHHLSVRTFSSPQLKGDMDKLEGAYYAAIVEDHEWPHTRAFSFARAVVELRTKFKYEATFTVRPKRPKTWAYDARREEFHEHFSKNRARMTRRPDQDRKARSPRSGPAQGELPL